MSLGCWNVRTLQDGQGRLERRTALLTSELARYQIDVIALSETRFAGEGQLTEMNGYTIHWIGKKEEETREYGVGFAIKASLSSTLAELPRGINERLMTLRLPLEGNRYVTLISAYAPTLKSSADTISSFYQTLRETILGIPKDDKLVLLGDFNARVGNDCETWNAIGAFGVGLQNDNGLCLLQLCTELDLVITNTFFHLKPIHKCTWTHPRSKQGHLIDYVIVRRRDLQDVRSTRVHRGADVESDHYLVRSKFSFNIRKNIRKGKSPPKRINCSSLKIPSVDLELKNSLGDIEFDGTWATFKDRVYKISSEVLGYVKRKNKDWFLENESQIKGLLHSKQDLRKRILNTSTSSSEYKTLLESSKSLKALVQRTLRQMKDQWWLNKSFEIQEASNKKDSKAMYNLFREVYGPQPSKVSPLRSKDGSTLIRDSEGIMNRWQEHYQELFINPSVVDTTVIENLPQFDVVHEMDNHPVLTEVITALKQMNSGKSPGLDGIPTEVLLCGGDAIAEALQDIFLGIWNGTPIPQEWKDAILVSLHKGKGATDVCGHFRGISLLVHVGKVFTRLLLNRLITYICPRIIPESQCGFRSGRGTVDMVFSARQIQEKCIEQRVDLYQVFIDLTKAFDTVNRDALWHILGKLGCPPGFVDKFKQLHDNMKAWVNVNGTLSDPVNVDNGVKQGDIPAPTLFSIYFSVVLIHAFENCRLGIYVRYRTSGKLFNLRRFNAKTKTFVSLIRDLLYADDCDLVAHSEKDLQAIMNLLSSSCKSFGLTISLAKTKVMFTPAPGIPYSEPNITVDGVRLGVVDKFVYLGSTISKTGSLDEEINLRIQKASISFGKLHERVWSQHNISLATKLEVYNACVLTSLLYASETWTTYRRHIKLLERFHQNCLRQILGIKWTSLTPDTTVLEKSKCLSIEAQLMKNHMRWVGHTVRLQDDRIPKQLLYGELATGRRLVSKPKKRFRDCTKDNLKQMSIDLNSWEDIALNRKVWREKIHKGVEHFETARIEHAKLKRSARKMEDINIPGGKWSKADLTCPHCNRILLSRAGYVAHIKSHNENSVPLRKPSLPLNKGNKCSLCQLQCKSLAGLKSHIRARHKLL